MSCRMIYEKLSPLGFTIRIKNIAQLLENPFYAGFVTHKARVCEENNRVGRGITPSPSHTTTHALARGGFSE